MRRKTKKSLYILLILLLVMTIGIGYAFITQSLEISNSASFDAMKFDIGFTSSVDNGGSIISESTISEDKKTITILCDFGTSESFESCSIKTTITNDSTFGIGLSINPEIEYDDTYIHTLTFKWNNHSIYGNTTVLKNNYIDKNSSEEATITIKNKILKGETLPTSDTQVPITITLYFTEWRNKEIPTKEKIASLKTRSNIGTNSFYSETYIKKIKTITFEDEINPPDSYIESWDIGVNENTVKAYVTENKSDSTYYDLYIQSNGQLYANKDMSHWFKDMTYVDKFNGIELLDTSLTTNMSGMFYQTGYNSSILTLDASNFDTSNVTDMSYMFYDIGYASHVFEMDVSGFDTSNVKDMRCMFTGVSHYSLVLTLDISNFDTRKVTNMSWMFRNAGYSNPNFTLDVSNFDTSNVTNMFSMFYWTGYNSTIFTLNVSNFDTSKVTNMESMFYQTGYNSFKFTLDLRNFDTSKVTNMYTAFYNTGYSSTKLNTSITIRNPNITSYESMFNGVATQPGSKITVNYTSETEALVDAMIATKSENSNVVKGRLVS